MGAFEADSDMTHDLDPCVPMCMTCTHCIPIGEGDHICDAGPEPILILEDYQPTDDYLWCNDEDWDEESWLDKEED